MPFNMNKAALFTLLMTFFSFLQCRQSDVEDSGISDCLTMLKMITNDSEWEYIYDDDFSKVEKIIFFNNPDRFTEYNYDDRGNLIQSTSFSNPVISIRREFIYNEKNQLIGGIELKSSLDSPYEVVKTVDFHYNENNQLDSASYFEEGVLMNGVKLHYNPTNPRLIDQTTNTYFDTSYAVDKWIYRHQYSDVKSPNRPQLSEKFSPELYPQNYHTEFMPISTEQIYVEKNGDSTICNFYYSFEFKDDCLKFVTQNVENQVLYVREFVYQ